MDEKEKRDFVINLVTNVMRTHDFEIIYKVKKKPKHMKIVFEVTDEEMQDIINSEEKQE
jgi:hypothetical protein